MLGQDGSYPSIEKLQDRDYSGTKVLLAEDNELNVEIAEELLKQVGIQVDAEGNGRLALERLLSMPEGYYDLVLMDIQMPEMNGYEATKAIRSSGRDDLKTLPIVAMTADVFLDDVRHAKEVGMNGHMAKPIEIENLLNILEQWVKH